MVPPASHKVPRVSCYSGYCQALMLFAYGIFTLYDMLSQNISAKHLSPLCSPQPQRTRFLVWPLTLSLAATQVIDFSFSSFGYLDVSVPRVPPAWLCIHHAVTGIFPARFPHSVISGSSAICAYPKLFAAYHDLHRLLVPRHPPYALISLN